MKRPIITLEDGVEVLKTTGDINAFEHGGGVLFRAPCRRDIFWTFWSARNLGEKSYRVFTAPIPGDVIEFFSPDLNELHSVSGIHKRDLKKMGCSKNPIERLELVMLIQECCGSSRVDPRHEPEILSIYELSDRWGSVFGVDSREVPKVDFEDFILRENGAEYECGSVDGKYLGKFTEYKSALCAIADCMSRLSREEANVFHEHSEGQLELVAWDPPTFIGKAPVRRGKLSDMRWRNAMRRYVRDEISKAPPRGSSNVFRDRRRAKARLNQIDRLGRAREIRQSLEKVYE